MATKRTFKKTEGKLGRNASYAIDEKGIMTIKVDLNLDLGASKSGKSNIIASTDGNKQIEGGDGAVAGINIYRSAAQ